MPAALLVVDVQYDFLPGGSLAVPEGDEILPAIQRLLGQNCKWNAVVASQDYHPRGHISFASAHKDGKVFTAIQVPDVFGGDEPVQQMLWPDHCIEGTRGCDIEHSIKQEVDRWIASGKGFIVHKGVHSGVEAYSAFAPAHSVSASVFPPTTASSDTNSPLASHLQMLGIKKLFLVGLATDYCVRATALDALKSGNYDAVYIIRECVRAVGGNEATHKCLEEFKHAGVQLVSMEDEVVRRMIEE